MTTIREKVPSEINTMPAPSGVQTFPAGSLTKTFFSASAGNSLPRVKPKAILEIDVEP
jgi:hypothetical protein